MPTQTKSSGSSNPFASGGTTNNVIPKSNGAGQLADSALTDNGTTVTSTERLVLPVDGTNAAISATGAATGIGLMLNNTAFVGLRSAAGSWIDVSNSANQALQLPASGGMGWSTSDTMNVGNNDAGFRRRGTANISMGIAADVNGTPVDQTLSVQNAITGSDLPGGHLTIDAPLGTGLGAASKISINRAIMKATGATAQTSQNAWAVGQSKTLSNTSATAQTIATITLGSNAGGGCAGTFTLVATDGTNFDSETQSFNVSFVNKAGAVTVGSVVATASTAANNSGSATLGITAVANGNNIDIKVTPVFGTIVPTTVTLYPVISHSTNTVTFV